MQLGISPELTRELSPQRAKALIGQLSDYVTAGKQTLIQRSLNWRTRYLTVVLEDIYQSQNASATVRTCDLLGIQDLHVIEGRNTFKINKAVTQGASKWVDIFRYGPDTGEATRTCPGALRERGYRLAALMPGANGFTPQTLPLDDPLALLFGTEETGLSPEVAGLADYTVGIPMFGFSRSYNLSVSVAIVLQSLTARLHDSSLDWRLAEEELLRLKLRWYAKSAANGEELLRNLMANDRQAEK